MKDEIKEILEQLEWYRKIGKKDVYYPECILPNKQAFILLDYITNLQEEKDKFKLRCYKALKLIRDNYGLLDKYGIDMIDDILNGGDDNE